MKKLSNQGLCCMQVVNMEKRGTVIKSVIHAT